MKNNLEIIDTQSNNSKNGFPKTINLEIHGINYEYSFLKSNNYVFVNINGEKMNKGWVLTNVLQIQSPSFKLFVTIANFLMRIFSKH